MSHKSFLRPDKLDDIDDEPLTWHRPLLYGFLWVLGAHQASHQSRNMYLEEDPHLGRISLSLSSPPPSNFEGDLNLGNDDRSLSSPPPSNFSDSSPLSLPKDDILFTQESAHEDNSQYESQRLTPKVFQTTTSQDTERHQSFEEDGVAKSRSDGGPTESPSWGWYSSGSGSGNSTPSPALGEYYPQQRL